MTKGFIRGVLWGAGVSFGAVTLVSVAGDGPGMRQTGGLAPVETAELADSPSQTKGSAGNRVALTGAGPAPDTLASIGTGTFDTAQVPETGFASALPKTEVPDFSSKKGLAATDTIAPSVTGSASRSLKTPDTDARVSVSTEPAQPPAPQASQQQTAFEESDVTQAPEVATSVQAPVSAPEVSAIGVDPVQPVVPAAPTTTTALAQKTESDVAQQVPEDVAQQETDIAQVTAPEAPGVMSEAPEVSSLSEETQSPELAPSVTADDTVAEDDRVADAPIPQVSTEVVVALAQPAETRLPQISPEAGTPDVPTADDLDAPAASDPVQVAGESASASVSVKVALDTIVAAPQLKPEPVLMPIAPQRTALRIPTAPVGIKAVDADAVASADTTLSVPPLTPKEKEPVAEPQTVSEVKINRLPTLGRTQDPVDETEPQGEVKTTVSVNPEDAEVHGLPPIQRFGQDFENPEGKPVMAFVLMDMGADLSQSAIGLPALRQLPYPVSFAVDASLPDATERMRAYRQEGFEVLAMVDLPDGATATDAEVNLSVALERLPEVVGVLEGVNTGVQTTRDSGRQVAQILAQTGHGFITQNQGLNTVQKLAVREGVPSAVVFRDFDSKDQSARVIGRFLDQAAFRAGQEGVVIMLGRMREETIAALLVWALQDRAARVALAPASGALLSTVQ